jgi:6-phosphogluconolactonase
MTTKVVLGQLVAEPDAEALAREAAVRLARSLQAALAKRGRATLALSGGNTPRATYALLAQKPGIDWAKVDVFWVDERAVAPDDDRSNYRWAKSSLIEPARIPPERIHRMRGEAEDLEAAAREYERDVREHVEPSADGVPVFDVIVLGIGDDGHTASLFPGSDTVDIVDRAVVAVPADAGREARLTLTSPVIESGRAVFVIAAGPGKHAPLERVWASQGDVRKTPARIIRSCKGAVTWLIDRAAGGLTE